MAATWPTVTDRNVAYPHRIKLVPVAGAADTYDVQLVTGTVADEGTPVNKALFDSIHAFIQDSVSQTSEKMVLAGQTVKFGFNRWDGGFQIDIYASGKVAYSLVINETSISFVEGSDWKWTK